MMKNVSLASIFKDNRDKLRGTQEHKQAFLVSLATVDRSIELGKTCLVGCFAEGRMDSDKTLSEGKQWSRCWCHVPPAMHCLIGLEQESHEVDCVRTTVYEIC